MSQDWEVAVEREGHVAVVELRRPPHNYVDADVLRAVADAVASLDAEADCRAIVLAAEGKSFCAGANFSAGVGGSSGSGGGFREGAWTFYGEAVRLFEATTPMVAAVHGGAIGGGAGYALVADLRVMCPEAYLWFNFTRLGIHPGFGTTVVLPELIGPTHAADLLLTSRRVGGEEAVRLGLANRCVPRDEVRATAVSVATEIAAAAPLANSATRATLRAGLAERVRTRLEHELAEQARLASTKDAAEGIRASFERRDPIFNGE